MKFADEYRERVTAARAPQALRAAVLLHVARSLCEALTLDFARHQESRLYQLSGQEQLDDEFAGHVVTWANRELSLSAEGDPARHLEAAHRLGEALDTLLAYEKSTERRKLGSYYTPVQVARHLIGLSVEQVGAPLDGALRICDPACGGGAFLLEAAASRSHEAQKQPWRKARGHVAEGIFGVDASALAVAVAELALWIFVGDELATLRPTGRFQCGDALMGFPVPQAKAAAALQLPSFFSFQKGFPAVFSKKSAGFDWIVGNPPWVAFQGRATQRISKQLRDYYRKHYQAFRGYPTLHGLFVERATQLAPQGTLTLLLPSSVSDLAGYQATRETVARGHEVLEPLFEYGQDAFESVVQPCFGLIARPCSGSKSSGDSSSWSLKERARTNCADAVSAPEFLTRWERAEVLPPDTFKEMGFQSNRVISAELFLRAPKGDSAYCEPLLEGRNVGEFSQRAPGLFLKPDAGVLSANRCRLRALEDYSRVEFVVRQTAAFTIAARHAGARFRNSLIAGYGRPDLPADLLVGLLNSALFRALHLSRQRDARQATFPQVKLQHLRKLPRPPEEPRLREMIESISVQASSQAGLSESQRQELDDLTFQLFGVSDEEAKQIRSYLQHAAPRAVAPTWNS